MGAQAETPEERRERLKALRAAAELSEQVQEPQEGLEAREEQPEEEQEEAKAMKRIQFRNYVPRDEKLQKLKRAPAPIAEFEVPKIPTEANEKEDPILSIAPKKANWDLRRDVAKKLEKLERRTQRAIIELMQEEDKRRQAADETAEDAEEMVEAGSP